MRGEDGEFQLQVGLTVTIYNYTLNKGILREATGGICLYNGFMSEMYFGGAHAF